MALFKRDYNKPGPGVPKNAPKKKGIPRFFELLGRDFSNMVRVNFWYVLCVAPAFVLFAAALVSFLFVSFGLFLILGLLALAASALVGPATTAMYLMITRMLRDEPGFVGHEFRKVMKENFKTTVVPGMIYSLLAGSQVVAALYYFNGSGALNMVLTVLYLFSVIVFNMAAPYFFMQAGYLDLGTGGMVKNSVLFALGYLPRTLAGLVIYTVLGWGTVVGLVFVPPLIILPLLFGVVVNSTIRLMWYWPQVDKTFEIDKTLKKRHSDSMDERMVEIGEHDKVVGSKEDE